MNFNSSIGYATNTTLDRNDPAYKWIDEGQVINFKNGGEGVNVIDPNIFIDTDGKKWLVYGSYKAGLRMVEVDPRAGKLFSANPRLITLTTSLGEGVYILKGPEYYYIFASRGKCCAGIESTYQVVMGRSKKPEGPYLNKEGESWVDNKYSLLLAGDQEEPGRGHNGFFTEKDTTYIVYHAYTRAANGASLLNIRPLYMDKEGWPSMEPRNGNLLFKNHK
jgi:arabinan endo-1,5-alpha-L-arabinosidase